MQIVKYRLVINSDNILVILEDGGVVDIRSAEELTKGDGRQSTTEYYQDRFTEDGLNSDEGIFGEVGLGKMYYNDWTTPFDDVAHVTDALEWLAPGYEYEVDETIWPDWAELEGKKHE